MRQRALRVGGCETSRGSPDMRECRARCADGNRIPHPTSAQASDTRKRGPLNNAINRGHRPDDVTEGITPYP